jgi:kinesin family protein 18/19
MSIYGPSKKKNNNKRKAKESKDFLHTDHSDKNMLVTIRVRPLSEQEISNKIMSVISVEDKLLIVRDKAEIMYEQEGIKPDVLHRSREQKYYFDKIFKDSSQNEVYVNTCKQLIGPVTKGYNACVFAYGTTGSGKTYTMIGYKDNPGNSVLIIDDMFSTIMKDEDYIYELKVSYVEIYNEIIRDLLVVKSKETYLDLRDDPIKGVQIAGVKEYKVTNSTEVMKLLTEGNKRRMTEATNANQTSSRSHAIFQIHVSKKEKTADTEKEILAGKLSLIDLAGSERGTATENTGIRLREGAKINTSLLALANCINSLGDKTKKGSYVSYRDSKLTRMLKDSLGGNCKTVMIATISPGHNQFEETINTLKYANRAKNIKIRAQVNKKMVYMHISAYKNIISDLKDEIIQLKGKIKNGSVPPAIDQINELENEDSEEIKEVVIQPKMNNLMEEDEGDYD